MSEEIISVENLTKKFTARGKTVTAVNGISFSIKKGEIVGLLGPNGAGKTTTIRMLLTYLIPDEGTIKIFGKDLNNHREEILQRVNFTFTNAYFGSRLTVNQILTFFGLLYGIDDIKKKVNELTGIFEIDNLKNKKVSELSSGEISKLSLCKALINNPQILFLDEPTASLDPDMADRTRKLIKEVREKEGTTILFTSHNMFEVEEMCQRVIFLHQGKILISGTPIEISRKVLKDAEKSDLQEVFIKISREQLI